MNIFAQKWSKITAQKKSLFWANFARIRRLYNKIRRFYNKDQEVMQQGSGGYVSNAIIEPLQKTFAYKG